MIFYKKCYEKQYIYRFKIKYGCCELLAKNFIENVLKNILLFKVWNLFEICTSKFVILVNKYLNGLPLNKVWFSQAISLWTRNRLNIFVLCRHQPYKRIASEANYFVWTSWYLGNFHKVLWYTKYSGFKVRCFVNVDGIGKIIKITLIKQTCVTLVVP